MNEKQFSAKFICEQPLDRTLFRNNIGMVKNADRVIKYGVCNPGGSDFIGWTEYVIRPGDVGRKLAVFTAIELKTGYNKPSKEQKIFLDAVARSGGVAECVWPNKIERYGVKYE